MRWNFVKTEIVGQRKLLLNTAIFCSSSGQNLPNFCPFFLARTKINKNWACIWWIFQVILAIFSINLLDLYKIKWKIMKIYKVWWNLMKFDEIWWNLMKFVEISQNITKFHDKTCYNFIQSQCILLTFAFIKLSKEFHLYDFSQFCISLISAISLNGNGKW